MAKRGIKVIDLFCGIGGLSHGFVQEDFNVVAGFDNDSSCKYAYEANNHAKFYVRDITTLSKSELMKLFGKSIRILIGCAPCQPFSSYSYKIKDKDSKKVNLLYSFLKIVKAVEPLIVSMENVPQLEKFENGQIFQDFYDGLKQLGYDIHYEIVYCPDYGIPQKRKRLVLLASKLGKISLIPKTHNAANYVTVSDTIRDLPPIIAGETDPIDQLHTARALSTINLERIQASKPGGSWREWPDHLILNCFKKESGRSYGSVYGRMKWNEPAPTMTTQCTGLGNGRFGHPEQNRGISLREAARFQTFPDDYKFFDDSMGFNPSIICRQIGNAVPPLLGRIIAKSIKLHLISYSIWQRKKRSLTTEKALALEQELSSASVPYNYDTKEYPIEVILSKYDKGEIFVPSYQRDFIWKADQKSKFIESLFLGVPIMPIFVSISGDEAELEIIDGSQRIRTIVDYCHDRIKIQHLEKIKTTKWDIFLRIAFC